MPFPTLEITSPSPIEMTGGVAKNVQLSIATNTVGKSTITLEVRADSCTFDNGTQQMEKEIESTATNEIIELVLPVTIDSHHDRTLMIRLYAEILNPDGETDDDKVFVKLSCRDDAATDSSSDPQPS